MGADGGHHSGFHEASEVAQGRLPTTRTGSSGKILVKTDETISTQDPGVVQRRKPYRVETPIPFSLTVIQSAEPELAGQHVTGLETENLRVNGVLFQTDLPQKEGDKAGLNLNLAQVLNAVGWVVRSRPVDAGVHAAAVMFLLLEKEEQRQLIQLIGKLA